MSKRVLDKGPNKNEALAFWNLFKSQDPEALKGLHEDQSRTAALLANAVPDLVPLDWWSPLIHNLKAEDAKKLVCQALLKLPRERSLSMTLDIFAQADESVVHLLKDVASQMVDNLPESQAVAAKERLMALALGEKPQSFAIARFCFKASWAMTDDEWLAFSSSKDADIRVEAILQMNSRQIGKLHGMAIDELYIAFKDVPTRKAIHKLFKTFGKLQGARHTGILLEYLNDARSADNPELKILALERLRFETGETFAAGSKKWEEALK